MSEERKPNGGSVHPIVTRTLDGGSYIHEKGITLRDYFAAKAMQGELACQQEDQGTTWLKDSFPDLAQRAYKIADAMLEKREENE